jgi:CS domain
MYVLGLSKGQSAQLLGQYKLPRSESADLFAPFRIHNAIAVSPELAIVLLSSRHQTMMIVDNPPSKGRAKRPSAEFDVWAARFSLPLMTSLQDMQDLDILWRRRGEDAPLFTTFDDSSNTFMLIGSSIYREIDSPPPPSYEPSPDEMAPIPRKDEVLDMKGSDPEKPPPYSWTQTSDSVTVAFPLPSSMSKSNIKVIFSTRNLTLHVQGSDTPASTSTPQIPLPHYSLKAFWDGISPSTSFWTWDREAEHAFGLLTLHLDKQHEGTRWAQVFASASALPAAEAAPDDVEVPETLDPSELGLIRESLEKYTAALRDGEDASGLGLGRGVPSLAQGEMDEDVDASVGRTVYLTRVVGAAGTPPPTPYRPDAPFTLLSTPLPGTSFSSTRPSLVVKCDIDGALFRLGPGLGPGPDAGSRRWSHVATFSALGFVLASKQDTRFTHHVAAKTVLAFESGSRDRGGNVYIYRGARAGDKWAKQAVVRAGGARAGSLLGVGAVKTAQGKLIILCLTERQLVLIHDVI